jgi:hypothetical protein
LLYIIKNEILSINIGKCPLPTGLSLAKRNFDLKCHKFPAYE